MEFDPATVAAAPKVVLDDNIIASAYNSSLFDAYEITRILKQLDLYSLDQSRVLKSAPENDNDDRSNIGWSTHKKKKLEKMIRIKNIPKGLGLGLIRHGVVVCGGSRYQVVEPMAVSDRRWTEGKHIPANYRRRETNAPE